MGEPGKRPDGRLNEQQWERVKHVVSAAMDRDLDAQRRLLNEAFPDEPELRDEARSLLDSATTSTWLPFQAEDSPAAGLAKPISSWPARIGPYAVDEEIGRGGMGVVFRAHRDDGQFEQVVAIKVIKRGMDSDLIQSRFLAERRILALLQHPNIARLLDGGVTADGRPYFVMEYVQGQTVDVYCDAHQMSIDDRLRLFLQICSAVESAHSRLILHRDLKAGNILVDESGQVKLLDFGIAKLLEQDEADLTATGMRLLTPQSASPEQIKGEALTTVSDVYSLGALLHLLLTGVPAVNVNGLSTPQALLAVCNSEPGLPSAVAPPGVRARLRGDLDNIVVKALARDISTRYSSVAELAGDIRRTLSGLPITARPNSLAYRVRKFAGRHRGSLALAAIVTLTTVVAITLILRAYRLSDRRFSELRGFAHSVVFEMSDAMASVPGTVVVRELLVKRSAEYLDRLSADAGDDPALLKEIADSYQKLGSLQGDRRSANRGAFEAASVSMRKSIGLYERLLQKSPSDAALRKSLQISYGSLSLMEISHGQLKAGLELAKKCQELAKLSKDPLDKIAAMRDLGYAYLQSRMLPEALGAYQTEVSLATEMAKAHPEDTSAQLRLAAGLTQLSQVQGRSGMGREAVQAVQKVMAIDRKVLGTNPDNAEALAQLSTADVNLGRLLSVRGNTRGATELFQEGLAMRLRLMAADPGNERVIELVATAYSLVVDNLAALHQGPEAIAYSRKHVAFAEEQNRLRPSARTQAGLAEAYDSAGNACASTEPKLCDPRREWERARTILSKRSQVGELNIDERKQLELLNRKLS